MPPELPDATVRYGAHHDAVVDLHLPGGRRPATPGAPLLVMLHGGFWKQEWDRRHTRPMTRVLAERGFVVATPEYRRVRGGGGWPVTGDDVEQAVRRLPELLAGLGISTGPTTVVGHSAGGHLALWLSTRGIALHRVVALAAVCDLREAIRLHLGQDATRALLGDADPSVADPMVLLEDPAADVRLVHGLLDDTVPISLARHLVAAHPWVRLDELTGVGHMEVIEPGSAAWPAVLAATQDV